MTRETKIGLLVGLAFIIVIGILLSDQRRGAIDPVPAPLAGAGAHAQTAMNHPGDPPPRVVNTDPINPSPRDPLPMRDELNTHRLPVVPTPHNPVSQDVVPQPPVIGGNPPQSHNDTTTVPNTGNDLLHRFPADLTPIVPPPPGPRDNSHGVTLPQAIPPATAVTTLKSYKAQSGDTVSKMAGRFLGSNTLANRQAIIDANPSLRDNPDNVILGRTYIIPGATAVPATPTTPTAALPPPSAPVAGEYYYTVEEGDTLWAIALDELGDANAVSAIKELNKNVLRGENFDVVRVGMKLRLPGKPVASAN